MTDWVCGLDDGHAWAEGGRGLVALDPDAPDPLSAITTATRTSGTAVPVVYRRMCP